MIVADQGLTGPGADGDRRSGAPPRRQGARGAEDDGAAAAAGRIHPGQGVPLFELRPPIRRRDWLVKRSFDIVASISLVVSGCRSGLPSRRRSSSILAARSSSRSAWGLNKEFTMLKFRTMVAGAERAAGLEWANEADGPLFKIRDDPPSPALARCSAGFRWTKCRSAERPPRRVTWSGRGRCASATTAARGVAPQARPRPSRNHRALADLGGSSLGFDDLVRVHFYYIETWSLWLDISILAKTAPVGLARRGAY